MERRSNKPTSQIIRAFALSTTFAMALQLVPARAAEGPQPSAPATTEAAASPAAPTADTAPAPSVTSSIPVRTRFLSLGIGKSVVVDLPRDVKDVLVADPKIANAVIRSSQRAYIIGSAVGQTNVVFFDAEGQQVASYDIAIKRDLNGIRAALKQSLPGVSIEGVGEGVVLTGSVASPIEAQQAGDIASRLVGSADKVVNSIVVRGRDQVMLKVTVAEVKRDIVKQMGIDLSASMNFGTAVVNFNNSNPFTANNGPLVPNNGLSASSILKGLPTVNATLRAMENAGVVHTLAEPNLTAISGESATFISGGEFPIPTGVTCQTSTNGTIGNCVQTVSFKKFGISLNFTPVVLSEGRISLRVMTEVSEVSQRERAHRRRRWHDYPLDQDPPRRNNPGNPVRRFDGDGRPDPGANQAGHQRVARRRPVAGSGTAFSESGLRQHETELMVLVTPYVVRAVAQNELSRPDDGFASASDSQSTLLARMNRIYGIAARVDPVTGHQSNFGFIID